MSGFLTERQPTLIEKQTIILAYRNLDNKNPIKQAGSGFTDPG
jgi:hypothetical protein